MRSPKRPLRGRRDALVRAAALAAQASVAPLAAHAKGGALMPLVQPPTTPCLPCLEPNTIVLPLMCMGSAVRAREKKN